MLRAVADVEQAVALDPEFKEAWVLDSGIRNGYAQFVDAEHIEDHRVRGEQAARRALELDPDFGDAYAALGLLLQTKRDWTAAEEAFRKAKSLNVPSASAWLLRILAASNRQVRRFRARHFRGESRAADPHNELFWRFLAIRPRGARRRARADDFYESGLSLGLFRSDSRGCASCTSNECTGASVAGSSRKCAAMTIADPLHAAMLASLEIAGSSACGAARAYDASGPGNPNQRRNIGLWAGHFGDPVLAFTAMRAALDEPGRVARSRLPQLAAMRRLPEFKAYMRETGMVAYWQEYGWPSFCRPLNEHDFECD